MSVAFQRFSARLYDARMHDAYFVQIQAKLFVRRLLCGIRRLHGPSFAQFQMVYRNEQWTHARLGFDAHPVDNLAEGIVSHRYSLNDAITAKLGLRINSSVRAGFANELCMAVPDSVNELFYLLANYIYHLTYPNMYPNSGYVHVIPPNHRLPNSWQQFIDDQWRDIQAGKF